MSIHHPRLQLAGLWELLTARRGSAPHQLATFPAVVASTLATLVDDVRTTSRNLAKCAAVVSRQASTLPAYLAAADQLITGPAARVHKLSESFFGDIETMMQRAEEMLAAVSVLRDGRTITDALSNAASAFTPSTYAALQKETTRLRQFFANFASDLITPAFEGMVTFVRSLLTPAVAHTQALSEIIAVQPYFDHLLNLPRSMVRHLASAADIQPVASLEALLPQAQPLNLATLNVFGGVGALQHDLAELLAPNSTCLADASCQASVQIRVRAMRMSSRVLKRRLAKVVSLPASLRGPLNSFMDLAQLQTTLLPDVEILSSWARALSGQTPDVPGSPHSHLEQQLARAMCMELTIRSTQGRDARPPRWFDSSSACGAMSSINFHLVDGPSFATHALEMSAKASPLFARLVDAMIGFNNQMNEAALTVTSLIESANGATAELVARTDAFTDAFVGVNTSFARVGAYVSSAQSLFELKAGIVGLEAKVEEHTSLAKLREMSHSASGALRHFNGASSPPFGCINVPLTCDAAIGSALQVEAPAAELLWDMQRGAGQVVPNTLLTGLGNGLCFFRASAKHVQATLEGLTRPLEKLIEFFVQGPSAIRGEAPQCAADDAYCLATVTRANVLYRMIGFPIFYLHFWSLGTPPLANPCIHVSSSRFTIPGLWSMSSMQSSTLLEHGYTYRGLNQCSRYTHLLAYAPAVPGGCTASYQSFLTTLDPFGMIHKVHPIVLPTGGKYAGTLSGLTVSRELRTAWACGKEEGDLDFSVFSFSLDDLDVGFEQAPLSYTTSEIRACHVRTLTGMRGTAGKEACLLHWDKKKQLLWAGNTAQPGEAGQAAAHNTVATPCGHSDSTVSAIGPLIYSRMSYGAHVTSFTFLTDVLGDDYVSIARCDNFAGSNSGKPCKLEFHEVSRSRGGMWLSNAEPTLTIRTPAGIGSLVHDTSLGVQAAGGGFFQASFVGMTSQHADDTANSGGEPEDRVFVIRTPFLKVGKARTALPNPIRTILPCV